jgi:predicted nucleotidyltransferase
MADVVDKEELLSRLRRFFSDRPEIAAAYLFGSAAGDRIGPLSDVDIAALAREAEALADQAGSRATFGEMQIDLASRLPALAGGRRVDVVILNEAPVHIAFPAVHEGLLAGRASGESAAPFEKWLASRRR